MSPVLFCHTLKCVWHCSPPIKGTQIFLRSGAELLREVFSAYRAAPEPSERRAVMGFVSVQIFERVKPLYGCCFSSGNEGLFVIRFFEKAVMPHCQKKTRDDRLYKSTVL